MKDIYKKPIFYYVLAPVLIGLWPLWLFSAGLPGAKTNYEKEAVQYQDAEKLIKQILEDLDPQRLDYAMAKKTKDEFDYATAVDQVTKFCRISASDYKLSSSPMRKTRGGQRSQDATMAIGKIDIETFAKFISIMQMRWSSLQCSNVTLAKVKGQKNVWKADIRFIYYQ
ncbi:MAG: hypothetical protein PHP01_06805 [Phycisphaerae bacterium]|nr:hypothetical protein [Phycisphaerae bacterium]